MENKPPEDNLKKPPEDNSSEKKTKIPVVPSPRKTSPQTKTKLKKPATPPEVNLQIEEEKQRFPADSHEEVHGKHVSRILIAGSYTLVFYKDTSVITVYDENRKLIENFNEKITSIEKKCDFPLLEGITYGQMADAFRPYVWTYEFNIFIEANSHDLKIHYTDFFEKLGLSKEAILAQFSNEQALKFFTQLAKLYKNMKELIGQVKKDDNKAKQELSRTQAVNIENIDITANGKYILCKTNFGELIVLQIRNAAGKTVKPAQWKRRSFKNYESFREEKDMIRQADLTEAVESFYRKYTGESSRTRIPLKQGEYQASISKAGYAMIKNNQGQEVFTSKLKVHPYGIIPNPANSNQMILVYRPTKTKEEGKAPFIKILYDIIDVSSPSPSRWKPAITKEMLLPKNFSISDLNNLSFSYDTSGKYFMVKNLENNDSLLIDTSEEVKPFYGKHLQEDPSGEYFIFTNQTNNPLEIYFFHEKEYFKADNPLEIYFFHKKTNNVTPGIKTDHSADAITFNHKTGEIYIASTSEIEIRKTNLRGKEDSGKITETRERRKRLLTNPAALFRKKEAVKKVEPEQVLPETEEEKPEMPEDIIKLENALWDGMQLDIQNAKEEDIQNSRLEATRAKIAIFETNISEGVEDPALIDFILNRTLEAVVARETELREKETAPETAVPKLLLKPRDRNFFEVEMHKALQEKEIANVVSIGSYTLILYKNAKEATLYDEKGNIVDDFDENVREEYFMYLISINEFLKKWSQETGYSSSFREKSISSFLKYLSDNNKKEDYHKILNLPNKASIQLCKDIGIALKAIEKKYQLGNIKLSHVSDVLKQKFPQALNEVCLPNIVNTAPQKTDPHFISDYFVLKTKTNGIAVMRVKDSQGNFLAPARWKRKHYQIKEALTDVSLNRDLDSAHTKEDKKLLLECFDGKNQKTTFDTPDPNRWIKISDRQDRLAERKFPLINNCSAGKPPFEQTRTVYIFKDTTCLQIVDAKNPRPGRWTVEEIEIPFHLTNPQYMDFDKNGDYLFIKDVSGYILAGREPLKFMTKKIIDWKEDPRGNFFIYSQQTSEGTSIVVFDKTSQKVTQEFPAADQALFSVDNLGHITFLDKNNRLQRISTNFNTFPSQRDIKKNQEQKTVREQLITNAETLFEGIDPVATDAPKPENIARPEELKDLQAALFAELKNEIEGAKTPDDLNTVQAKLDASEKNLLASGENQEDVDFILLKSTRARQKKIDEIRTETLKGMIIDVREKVLEANLPEQIIALEKNLKQMDDLKKEIEELEKTVREDCVKLKESYDKQLKGIFQQKSAEIIENVKGIVIAEETRLQKLTSMHAFEDWMDQDYVKAKTQLTIYKQGSKAYVAHNPDLAQAINEAIGKLNELTEIYGKRFSEKYAEVRENVYQDTELARQNLADSIRIFCGRLKIRIAQKKFKDREEAEKWVLANEQFNQIQSEISILSELNNETAGGLRMLFEINLTGLYVEIKQVQEITVDTQGRLMTGFGNYPFPIFEGPTQKKEEVPVRTQLKFAVSEDSKKLTLNPDEFMGDLVVKMTQGKDSKEVCLFEDLPHENDWRYGKVSNFYDEDRSLGRAFTNLKESREIIRLEREWRKQDSLLRTEYQTRCQKLQEKYKELKGQNENPAENKEYRKMFFEYLDFMNKKKIWFLRRVDNLRARGIIDTKTNGKGYVPKKEAHWVEDEETEKNLEQIAEMADASLTNKEGLVMLNGHAGVGKDVLVKMFCNRANRKYFRFDCSKWTTEFDLSEDIILDSEHGVSVTKKIASLVMDAIKTPGALLYFNEFNALPHVVQVFLHALFDESRSITLKTSQGKTVLAENEVLFMGSQNVGYPGTFTPGLATESRFLDVNIDYSPLMNPVDPQDASKGEKYNYAEAIKIARSVNSLRELTTEADMSRNDFVQLWDNKINKIDTGIDSTVLTQERKFDLDVILGLVQFTNSLREIFLKHHDPDNTDVNLLPVDKPITMRELRRCAFFLGKLSLEKKKQRDPEEYAKELLNKVFLARFFNSSDREKISTAMKTWSMQTRVVNN